MIGLMAGYGYYGYYYDPTYLLMIIAAVLSLAAQFRVNSAFSKYSQVGSRCGLTGAQVAERILQSQGIYDVAVCHVPGRLTDHYHPGKKVLNLSDDVYGSTSIAAIGVAAHECGHAIQHAKGYMPLSLRTALVPVANIGSGLSWIFIIAGVVFSFNHTLITFGILLFSAAVLFQLVTLPVEFNASSRALYQLEANGILQAREAGEAKKVLSAAALTYVAAAATAILQLLRLIILFGGRSSDDR